jgi:hypothetical protein
MGCSRDEWILLSPKGGMPRSRQHRAIFLSTDNMRRVYQFGKNSAPKKCNHSVDLAARQGVTILRDFFVNYEHTLVNRRIRAVNCCLRESEIV